MRAIGWLFRVLAYLYHLGLSLLLLALASVAILSGAQNLNLEMTPWHVPYLGDVCPRYAGPGPVPLVFVYVLRAGTVQ